MDMCVDQGMRQASLQVQSQFFYEEAHFTLIVGLLKDSKPRSLLFIETMLDVVSNMKGLMQANFSESGGIVTRRVKVGGGVAESDEEEDRGYQERIYTLERFHQVCFGDSRPQNIDCYDLAMCI